MTYTPQVSDPRLPLDTGASSYIDWAAILGGIIFASAISVVLLSFGSALGLVFANVTTQTYSLGASVAVAIWFLWVEVSSFMAGAYLTGRLRRRATTTSSHETEVRDGSHGLLVWAGCVVLGTVLAFNGAFAALNSVGSVVKTATQAAATTSQGSAPAAMQYYSDTLLRPGPAANSAAPKADRLAVGTEVSAILAHAALTSSNNNDKAYLAQLVSNQTGLSADDAKVRVDKTYADLNKAKADAAAAADTARRIGIIAAFLLAASLLVSAAAAYWAASSGGNHRDEEVVHEGFFKRVPRQR